MSWVASNFEAGAAAFDRHTFGDFGTYLYKTTDCGKSWTAPVSPLRHLGLRGLRARIEERWHRTCCSPGTEVRPVDLDRWRRQLGQFKGKLLPSRCAVDRRAAR